MGFSLSRLLGSTDVGSFVEGDWARRARLFPRSLEESAHELLSLSSFELLLATLNRAHEGWLHFARGGLKPVPPAMVDRDGMLDLRKVRAAFAGGETLYLTKAQRLSPPLMHLCRSVELELMEMGIGLREPVNAHVFLTPPGSQGFPPHRDEHASFVLQIDGTKDWTVYEPDRELPRLGEVDRSALGKMDRHFYRLQAGDVLYMPEWWPHEARASSSHSLHVTLRIFPLRWVDLVLELAAEHPELSGPVPRGLARKPAALSESLLGILGSEGFPEPLPSLLEGILQRRQVPRNALPDDGFRQVLGVDQIELDTRLELPAGTSCTIIETRDEVCVRFPGGVLRGPAVVKEVFEYVASVNVLRPRDLPPVAGQTYDRLDFARTMVRDGLLRIAG